VVHELQWWFMNYNGGSCFIKKDHHDHRPWSLTIVDHVIWTWSTMVYRQWSAMDYHGSSWFLSVIFPWFHLPLR